MLMKGADPRHTDNNGNTLLHFCLIKTGSNPVLVPEMAGLLVQTLGVDVNAQNRAGVTALFMNIFGLTPDEIRFMVEELKADITIKTNNGQTVYEKHIMNGVPKTTWPPVLDKFKEICSILKC
jgi:ankyrin repeat protein